MVSWHSDFLGINYCLLRISWNPGSCVRGKNSGLRHLFLPPHEKRERVCCSENLNSLCPFPPHTHGFCVEDVSFHEKLHCLLLSPQRSHQDTIDASTLNIRYLFISSSRELFSKPFQEEVLVKWQQLAIVVLPTNWKYNLLVIESNKFFIKRLISFYVIFQVTS